MIRPKKNVTKLLKLTHYIVPYQGYKKLLILFIIFINNILKILGLITVTKVVELLQHHHHHHHLTQMIIIIVTKLMFFSKLTSMVKTWGTLVKGNAVVRYIIISKDCIPNILLLLNTNYAGLKNRKEWFMLDKYQLNLESVSYTIVSKSLEKYWLYHCIKSLSMNTILIKLIFF